LPPTGGKILHEWLELSRNVKKTSFFEFQPIGEGFQIGERRSDPLFSVTSRSTSTHGDGKLEKKSYTG
jgi:hypothetical protein